MSTDKFDAIAYCRELGLPTPAQMGIAYIGSYLRKLQSLHTAGVRADKDFQIDFHVTTGPYVEVPVVSTDRCTMKHGGMSYEKRRLLSLVKQHALTVAAPDAPPFRLASGAESRWYCDLKQLLLSGEAFGLIGRLLWDAIYNWHDGDRIVTAVGGPESAALPITASIISAAWHGCTPPEGFSVRREPKGHGAAPESLLWGRTSALAGRLAVVVEDVCTTGASAVRAVDAARTAGMDVVGVACVLDRGEGGREACRAADVGLFASLLVPGDLFGEGGTP